MCATNWVTDIYDKMDISVRTLDIALVVLCAIVVFCLLYLRGETLKREIILKNFSKKRLTNAIYEYNDDTDSH